MSRLFIHVLFFLLAMSTTFTQWSDADGIFKNQAGHGPGAEVQGPRFRGDLQFLIFTQ